MITVILSPHQVNPGPLVPVAQLIKLMHISMWSFGGDCATNTASSLVKTGGLTSHS